MGMTSNAIAMLLLFASLELTMAVDPTSDQSSLDFPVWAVVVMAVIVGLLVLLLCYFVLRRYLSSRRTVSVIDQVEKHHTPTTNTESTVTMDSINKRSTQVYKPAMIDQDKMALPFPPLSSSLFSDKMELNSDDAMQLFERYMQTDRPNKAGGLTTIDIDMPQLVKQKMGTIKSTLRQSLRRQKSKSRSPAALNHMFDTPEQPSPSRKSLSELSRHTPSVGGSSSSPEVPPYVPSAKLPKTVSTPTIDDASDHLDSNRVPTVYAPSPIDNPLPTPASPLPKSPLIPSSSSTTASESSLSSSGPVTTSASSSPTPLPPSFHPTASPTATNPPIVSQDENAQQDSDTSAIHAARRVIRSASRKSKTRSTLINDDAVLKMFSQGGGPNSFALPPEFADHNVGGTTRDQRRASTAAAASGFTTISGRSSNNNAASTRYLTNDILVRRASTLGKSFQQQRKPSASRLENLFDTPCPSPPPPSTPATPDNNNKNKNSIGNTANEKVEVTELFDLAQRQDTLQPSNQGDSSTYVNDALLHPKQQQSRYSRSPSPSSTSDTDTPSSTAKSSLVVPSISTGSKKRNTLLTNNDGKRIIQDRMDNFEGVSAHTDSTGHSRKSSTSVATMVRISQQHSQTWSGRGQSKRASLPQHEKQESSSTQQQQQNQPSQSQQKEASSAGNNNDSNKRPPMTFYTMRNTRTKQRTGLPSWYNPDDAQLLPQIKTPAERERDQYLKTLYGTDNNDTNQG